MPARRPRQQDDALRRAARLFRIVTLVFSRPPGDPLGRDELSLECGCDPRTVQRDLDLLREAGVPLEYDRAARAYALPEKGWVLPIDPLTPQDALALALIRGLLAGPGVPQREALLAVLDKATAGLPPALRALLQDASAAVRPAGAARDYSHAPLDALVQAAAARQSVEIDYESATSGRSWRRVDPYAVEPRDGQFWELHAWDPKHGQVRTFALDRIVGMRGLGEAFTLREAEWAAFAGAIGVIGGLRGGTEEAVDVLFAPPVAPYALARRWPAGLTATPQPDGAARLTGTVAGLDGITAELLRWRRHAQALGGPALRARMRAELAAMAALYDGPPPENDPQKNSPPDPK
ncbi:MAG: WYL domain-containing protein [Armatimonadetes bacterium]|nr:WYL domain-containing protein [Armatimonadota bacterium]